MPARNESKDDRENIVVTAGTGSASFATMHQVVQAGHVGRFLLEALTMTTSKYNAGGNEDGSPTTISDDELIGKIPLMPPPASSEVLSSPHQEEEDKNAYSNLKTITDFFIELQEVQRRRGQQNSPTTNAVTAISVTAASSTSSTTQRSYYDAAIAEFASSQMERQGAGLRTSTSQENAQGLLQVVFSHNAAMRMAMAHAEQQLGNEQVGQQNKQIGTAEEATNDVVSPMIIETGSPPNQSFPPSSAPPPTSSSTPFYIPNKNELCAWHSILCPGAAPTQRGRFRTAKQVAKVGTTIFCPGGSELDAELDAFALAMECLYNRWTGAKTSMMMQQHTNTTIMIEFTYRAVAMAAIMLYGISDLHCFVDGNGRMARICTNWILQRVLGLPFTVAMTATPAQRSDYLQGLRNALRRIVMLEKSSQPVAGSAWTPTRTYSRRRRWRQQQQPRQPPPSSLGVGGEQPHGGGAGIFEELTHLLLDRVAHSVRECQRVIEEKSQAAVADEEARIARRVRERAAAGQCIICLEDQPNILTICCGQAVHMNCLAEWLGTADNCVACRRPLPTLQVRRPRMTATRISPGMSRRHDYGDDDDDGYDDEYEGRIRHDTNDGTGEGGPSNPRNDVWNAVLTNMLWDAAATVAHGTANEEDDEEEDDDEDIDDDYREYGISARDSIVYCCNDGCTNPAALHCENDMCRHCCHSDGPLDCPRHEWILNSEIHEMDNLLLDRPPPRMVHPTAASPIGIAVAVSPPSSSGRNGSRRRQRDDGGNHFELVRCRQCNNQAAVDCENQMCARHCVLCGWNTCPRHNNRNLG